MLWRALDGAIAGYKASWVTGGIDTSVVITGYIPDEATCITRCGAASARTRGAGGGDTEVAGGEVAAMIRTGGDACDGVGTRSIIRSRIMVGGTRSIINSSIKIIVKS